MWRMKKRKLIYWWVDYIKAFINEKENENKNFKKLIKLSANTNQIFIDFNKNKLSVTLIPGWKYKFLYSINYWDISVGFIWLYGWQSPDMIEITWQGLTIFWESLFYFLFSYFGLNFVKYKRIDLCFDMELLCDYFFDRVLLSRYKEKDQDWKYKKNIKPWITAKNWVETIEIWTKNIKQNSYAFIRIYNKIIDSKKKKKLFLYEDLYKKDNKRLDVTRFEVELREDIVKRYPFDFCKDYQANFFRIVKSFYNFNSQFFKFLKDSDFEEFKKSYNDKKKTITEKIKAGVTGVTPITNTQARAIKLLKQKQSQDKYWNDFIDEADKQRTLNMWRTYTLRLHKNGYSLEDLLWIYHNIINENDEK